MAVKLQGNGMDATSDSARKGASREATEWSVLLHDDPDDSDLRRRFEAWRGESALNAAAWENTQRVAHLAAEVLPAYADEWTSVQAAAPAPQKAPVRLRTWGLSAVSMAIAAAIAWLALPDLLLRLEADHLTGTAELRTFQLPDGSEVTLAPDSAVSVSYEAGERRVRLVQGEAFFAVSADRDRPFKVTARSVQAVVLGTKFDVRLEDAAVAVAVQEGRVLVEASEQGEALQAGEAVRVTGKGVFVRASEEPGTIAAWRHGQLLLRNQSLGEAVSEIRRYFRGTIIVTDPSLERLPTTGVFNMSDPEEALRGLAQAHGAKVRRWSPWLLVVSGS